MLNFAACKTSSSSTNCKPSKGLAKLLPSADTFGSIRLRVDPDKLRFHNISLDKLAMAIKGSNVDVGAKTVESTGMEFIVRGKGFLGTDGDKSKAISDIEDTVILQRDGVPVRVSDVAEVQLGPDFRRGALDYNGAEAVGGVVVMRYGENPRVVIDRVKAKIAAIEPG